MDNDKKFILNINGDDFGLNEPRDRGKILKKLQFY